MLRDDYLCMLPKTQANAMMYEGRGTNAQQLNTISMKSYQVF